MAAAACSHTHHYHRLLQGLDRFSQCTILVVGDLMLDVFLWGDVRRISPEAPVPVVEVRRETHVLGGAGNVVHNIVSMGGKARMVGVVGNDAFGREIRNLLQEAQVPCLGLVTVHDRPTTVKTRVIAQHQQVVRVDWEDIRPVEPEGLLAILHAVETQVRGVDAVVVSDYAKGVISLEVMDAVRALAQQFGIPVFVDPKVPHAEFYHHVTLVTPNTAEASAMAGVAVSEDISLEAVGRLLLEKLQCRHVLITRGPEGMSLFEAGAPPLHIPTVAKKVFDVTGAGDTVIAAIALAAAAGLNMREAALVANTAAGIVVGEVGTAAVEHARLRAALQDSGGGEG
ncbi:MAG: D-glycero-beta-D-manno-heptose-7-phosphate kinase [Desulfosoma sp.]|uniref:D-glycero-beta-D-manno-heptose-7-phosphate kinase n=1 Tax=Desulfosoma sp. TaxID=2603217 RepID=UPI00404B73F2